MPGKLILLPNVLDEEQNPTHVLSPEIAKAVASIDGVIAEGEKSARRFLKHFQLKKPLQEMTILLLNEHTPKSDLEGLLEPLVRGETWGLLSDAGLPCIADPGSDLVTAARQAHIEITAFPGPSSIVQALLLSGFSGQQFTFHGYLPKEPEPRKAAIRELEKDAVKSHRTQIFIETPYRNRELLTALVETLQPDTQIAVAWDISTPREAVKVGSVRWFKNHGELDFHKKPAIFLVSK